MGFRTFGPGLFVVVSLILGTIMFDGTQPAGAFDARWWLTSGISISYAVDPSFFASNFDRNSLYSADWAWEVQSLGSYVNFYNNDTLGGTRRIMVGPIDGPTPPGGSSTFAQVQQPPLPPYCEDESATCSITFDIAEHWNTTSEIRDSTWLDFISVAVHEFGHWVGLQHSNDRPSTDNALPAMQSPFAYGRIQRVIRQDDANGMHTSRPAFPIMSANDSFEFTSPFYGFNFKPSSRGGSMTRYCNDSFPAYNGACFVEYNGNGAGGASVYQDMYDRGWNNYSIRGRVRARNRGGSPTSFTVTVWELDPNIAHYTTCSLPADTSWVQCYTPFFDLAPGSVRLRLEAYNNSSWNVDIDTMIVW